MSIFLAQGDDGALLDELIGAADAMNHAIPTHGELSRAFTRLASRGIVTIDGDRYRIAEVYLSAIKKANDGKGGLFQTPEKGKQWLSHTRFDVSNDARVTITEEQLALAYECYRERLRRR